MLTRKQPPVSETGFPDPDHIPPAPGKSLRYPLWSASVVIYGTLALLALTVPRGLVSWSRDLDPGARQEVMRDVALAIRTAARSIGADRPYEAARDWFLRATGKSED
jgi:hypothetical protein